ncbi:AlpA family transcriptional regulator [Vibrio rumoiensis]|uniref:AlpA family transcriptional regulator n=1 Tax=Vibrio rumoiensis TaxID=76258 RepID=UPI003747E65A
MKIIRLKEVISITGLSKTTIYSRMAENAFPKTISLGKNSVGWIESEIYQWVENLVADRDGEAA